MKRVMVEKIGSVAVVDAPEPSVEPGWALVRTIYAGICGSDTHAVAGHHPLLPPPYAPGHEAVGVVVDGDPALAGRRVALKPNIACGTCVPCRAGRSNACETLRWIGCDSSGRLQGAMAERFVAPSGNLYPVPDDVSDEQAALVECFATPVHAARIAGDLTGRNVVILGSGTIGALELLAVRDAGAGRVVVTDLEESKRARALRLGAHAAVDAGSATFADDIEGALGGKADFIFDCVAMEVSAKQWLGIVHHSGTICVVGVPNASYPVPMPWVQDWELKIQGCANYNEIDFQRALTLGNQIPADEIVTSILPLSEGAQAFATASANTSGKILVTGEL